MREGAVPVRLGEPCGGEHGSRHDCFDCSDEAEGSCGRDGVAKRPFDRRDVGGRQRFPERLADGARLDRVIQRRRGAVRLDHVDRLEARLGECEAHRPQAPTPIRRRRREAPRVERAPDPGDARHAPLTGEHDHPRPFPEHESVPPPVEGPRHAAGAERAEQAETGQHQRVHVGAHAARQSHFALALTHGTRGFDDRGSPRGAGKRDGRDRPSGAELAREARRDHRRGNESRIEIARPRFGLAREPPVVEGGSRASGARERGQRGKRQPARLGANEHAHLQRIGWLSIQPRRRPGFSRCIERQGGAAIRFRKIPVNLSGVTRGKAARIEGGDGRYRAPAGGERVTCLAPGPAERRHGSCSVDPRSAHLTLRSNRKARFATPRAAAR